MPPLDIAAHIPPGELEKYKACRLSSIQDDEFRMAVCLHYHLSDKQSYLIARPEHEGTATSTQVRNLKNSVAVTDQIARFNIQPSQIPGRIMQKAEFDAILSSHARGDSGVGEKSQLKAFELLGRSRGYFSPGKGDENEGKEKKKSLADIVSDAIDVESIRHESE